MEIGTVITAHIRGERAWVNVSCLLADEESETAKDFRLFLQRLEEVSQYRWPNGGLEGSLLSDEENAHAYVALHLWDFDRFIADDPEECACISHPAQLLWSAMALGAASAKSN